MAPDAEHVVVRCKQRAIVLSEQWHRETQVGGVAGNDLAVGIDLGPTRNGVIVGALRIVPLRRHANRKQLDEARAPQAAFRLAHLPAFHDVGQVEITRFKLYSIRVDAAQSGKNAHTVVAADQVDRFHERFGCAVLAKRLERLDKCRSRNFAKEQPDEQVLERAADSVALHLFKRQRLIGVKDRQLEARWLPVVKLAFAAALAVQSAVPFLRAVDGRDDEVIPHDTRCLRREDNLVMGRRSGFHRIKPLALTVNPGSQGNSCSWSVKHIQR